jgi:hypothetical protein
MGKQSARFFFDTTSSWSSIVLLKNIDMATVFGADLMWEEALKP